MPEPEYRQLSASRAVRNSGVPPTAGRVPVFTGVNNDIVESSAAPVLQNDPVFERVTLLESGIADKADQDDVDAIVAAQNNLGPRVKTAFGSPLANEILISNGSADLDSASLDSLVIAKTGSDRIVKTGSTALEGIEFITPAVATPWDILINGAAGLADVDVALDRWNNQITAAVAEDIVSNVYTFNWPTAAQKNVTSVRTINISANTEINVPALLGPSFNPEIAAAGRIIFLKLIITNTSGGNVTVQPASAATGRMPLVWQSGLVNQTLPAGTTITLFVYIRGNSGILMVAK